MAIGFLNVTGIGSSTVCAAIEKDPNILKTSIFTEGNSVLFKVKFKGGDFVHLEIPRYFEEAHPNRIINELVNYIMTTLKKDYPEYFI